MNETCKCDDSVNCSLLHQALAEIEYLTKVLEIMEPYCDFTAGLWDALAPLIQERKKKP